MKQLIVKINGRWRKVASVILEDHMTMAGVKDIEEISTESKAENLWRGYTNEQLHQAFDLVKNKEDWKLPIRATVPADADLTLIHAAISFFCGGCSIVTKIMRGPAKGSYLVKAPGYYIQIGS